MESTLSIVSQSFIRKRLLRELQMLSKNDNDIEITANDRIYSGHLYEYNIRFSQDGHSYDFTISDKYPFNPPKVAVNGKPLSFYHNVTFRNSLQKYTGIHCFCCETILCSNNWMPQYTMYNVVQDIRRFRDATRQITLRVIIDVIKRKYLIDDINLVDWLY